MRLSTITAATEDGGTKYYKISRDDLASSMSSRYDNVWTDWLLENRFEESIIDDVLFDGSSIKGDDLYYCITDYLPIDVDGEEVNPEEALALYSLSSLSEYIVESVPDSVLKKISEDDFNWGSVDIEDVAIALLSDGLTFSRICADAESISLV